MSVPQKIRALQPGQCVVGKETRKRTISQSDDSGDKDETIRMRRPGRVSHACDDTLVIITTVGATITVSLTLASLTTGLRTAMNLKASCAQVSGF